MKTINLTESRFYDTFRMIVSSVKRWKDIKDETDDVITDMIKAITVATAETLNMCKSEDHPVGYPFVKDINNNLYFGAIVEFKPDDKSWKFYYVMSRGEAPENTQWIDTTNTVFRQNWGNFIFDIGRIDFIADNSSDYIQVKYAEALLTFVKDNLTPDSPEVEVVFDDLLKISGVLNENDEAIIKITPGGELKQIIKGSDYDK